MKNTFSFDINCTGASISPNGNRGVTVTVDDVEKSDVLDLFDIQECLDHFGESDVLGYIDAKKLEDWAESNGYSKQ